VRPCGLLLGGWTLAQCRGPAACSWALGGRTDGGAVSWPVVVAASPVPRCVRAPWRLLLLRLGADGATVLGLVRMGLFLSLLPAPRVAGPRPGLQPRQPRSQIRHCFQSRARLCPSVDRPSPWSSCVRACMCAPCSYCFLCA
jgi:hypothetical protein